MPMPTDYDAWPHYEVVKDSFWSAVSELILGIGASPEGDEEAYQILFEDNTEGDGSFISSRSLLKMHEKKIEAA